jgi:outer membrane lipoprotein-sorting protein
MTNRPHDDWEKLFEELPVEPTAREEHREHLKRQVLDAYESTPTPQSRRLGLKEIGRLLMKYKAPQWTAASVLVSCVIWLVWLTQTGGTPVVAAEEVVDNLVNARSARYDMTANVIGQPPQKWKAFYLAPNHFRQELESGYVNIADWTAGIMVGLDTENKRATVFKLKHLPADPKQGMQVNQFQAIREMLRNAVADPDAKVELLGEMQLDGRTVVGFRFKQQLMPMTLWADPLTKLPVRIEVTMAGPPQTEVVMTNYEFNVDLDKSLFSVAVPDGYKVMKLDVDASPQTEDDFITSLRMCCKATDGKFPDGLGPAAIAKYVAMYVVRQGIDKDNGPSKEQMQEVMLIGRGFQFALTLPATSDAHYAGAGVKQGEADRAIFWYKPVDSTKYRVIYADFSVKESDTAPQVPNAKKLTF